MNSSRIKRVQVLSLKAPLIQPFRIASGQHDELDNILFTIELGDGTRGLGEAAAAAHITGETVTQTARNLKSVKEYLIGKDASAYLSLFGILNERLAKNKSALAAVEMAALDALTRQWKIPLWRFFGSTCRLLKSDITMVIGDLEETAQAAARFYQQGFRTFKVKVGRDMDVDLQRVMLVHRLTKKSKIILDANQAYSARQAMDFLKRLQWAGVEPILFEQPVPKADWDGLKKLTRSVSAPICADESASSLRDVTGLIRKKAVDVINVKLMKTGILEAREIVLTAKRHGVGLMIGGMMESSLAMTAAAHLAAGMGGFDYIDLDTPFFIKKGWDRSPCLNRSGVYDLSKVKAGIGIIQGAQRF